MKITKARSGDQVAKEVSELRKRVAELEERKAEHVPIEASPGESEHLFRMLVERAAVGVYVIQNGRLIYVNQASVDILGYDVSELSGKSAKFPIFAEDWPMIEENLNKRLSGEVDTINYQFRGIRKDGTVIWLEVYGSTMVYKDRQSVIGTVTDITDRVQAERELLLERQRFEILSEHAPYGLAMISDEGEFKYVNPKFKELFGYDLQDIPNGKQWFNMLFPSPSERRTAISAWLSDMDKSRPGEPRPRTFEIVCKDGLKKTVHFMPVQLDNGDHLMTCEDITERKKAEDELRESERKYRDLFDGAPVGIFQSTIDGRLLSVNPAYARMYGHASAEQAAQEIDNVAERIYVEPGRRNKLIDLALIADGFVKAENQYRKKEGSLFWGQLYFRLVRDRDGEVKHLEGFVEDITDRKRAEEGLRKREAELRASHAQFEAFMDNSPLIAFMRDDQGRYVYVNRLFLSNNNLSSSQVLGKTADEIFPAEMAHKVTKEDLNVVESNTTIASVESLVDHIGDQREWWLIRFPVRDADGLRYLGGVGLDLTESIRAQKALEASEARFRQIYERVPIMIHSADRDGVIRNVNRRWLSHMGYDREEVIGHSLDDFIIGEPGAEPGLVRSQLWAKGTTSNVQRRYVKKDGSIIDSVLDSIIIDDPVLGRVSLTAVNDITALKRAEDEIKKSLEEKEVLLREINHRVKNNLQVMSSLVRLQARQITAESCNQALQETQNRLQTIGLIHEMLHQSRNLAHIDVEGYLKRLIANLFSLYGAKSSQIETTIDAQELRLGVDKADPLGLIANELVSNCLKYAFPAGRKGIIRISLAVESNEFQFMVSDNGVGLRKDFDPFNAQTLGLVLVNTLVKQLNGVMSVKRTAGTKFLIRFPVSTS